MGPVFIRFGLFVGQAFAACEHQSGRNTREVNTYFFIILHSDFYIYFNYRTLKLRRRMS